MSNSRRFSLLRNIAVTTIGSFILLAILNGLIGNGVYAFAVWVLGVLAKYLTTNWLLSIIAFVLILGCIVDTIILWRHSTNLNQKLEVATENLEVTSQKLEVATENLGITSQKLEVTSQELETTKHGFDIMHDVVELDDSLLRLLVSLVTAKDPESEVKRLLEELLRDATKTFSGNVHRALILVPDKAEEYLTVLAHFQMPPDTLARTKFYIGQEEIDRKPGVAGEAFLSRKIVVGHIIDENCDRASYITFDCKRPHIPYRSMVNVPIIGLATSGDQISINSIPCLGVLCFDSMSPTVFDSSEAHQLLQVLGRRAAVPLSIYRHL